MCGVYSLRLWTCLALIYLNRTQQWYTWDKNFEISSDTSPYQLWWRLSPRPADKALQILHVDRPTASFTFYYLHLTNELCLKHQQQTGAQQVRFITQSLGNYDAEIKMTWGQDDTLTGEKMISGNQAQTFNFGDVEQFGSEIPCYGDDFELLNKEIGELGSNGVIPSADIKPDLIHCQTQGQNGCAICVDFFAVKETGTCRFCGIGCNKCRDLEAEPQCSNCDHNYFAQTNPYCLSSGALTLNEAPHFFTANAPNPRLDFALTFWIHISPTNPQGTTAQGVLVRISSEDNTEQDLLLSVQNKPGILNIVSMLQANTPTGSFPLTQKKWICVVLQQSGNQIRGFDAHNNQLWTSISSPFSAANPPTKFRFGNEFNQAIVYNLKYLTLFSNQADRASHYQKVIGFQQPSASLPAYIQECWSLQYFSNQGAGTSCSGGNALEQDTDYLTNTMVQIRLKHQPSSDLQLCDSSASQFFQDGKCVACTVGCQTCFASDMCTKCVEDPLYSGPNNGYCVQDTLTPESGKAQLSDFRVRDEFLYLQENLGSIKYLSTRCEYPDGSRFQSQEQKFKLPRSKRDEKGIAFEVSCEVAYEVKNERFLKVSVIQLEQTQAYDLDTNSPRAPVDLVLFLNSYQSQTEDECGGCLHGTCIETSQSCRCDENYVGTLCQFREDEAVTLKQKIKDVVEAMNQRSDPFSLQIMIMGELYKYPTLMTTHTNAIVTELLSGTMEANLKRSEVEAGLAIFSGLYQAIRLIESEPQLSTQLQHLVQVHKDYSAAHIADTLSSPDSEDYSYTDRRCSVVARYLLAGEETTISIGTDATIVMSPQKQDMKLIAIVSSRYQNKGLYPANQEEEQVSSTLELNMYSVDGKPLDFQNSEYNLCLKTSVMPQERDTLDIKYWDGNQMSSAGISDCKVQGDQVCCTCTHMTSFAGFLRRGKEIIEQANYDVFSSLKSMTAEDLSSNLGFYFLIFYWGLFTVIFFILKRYESNQMRKIGLEKIIRDQLSRDQEILTYTSGEQGLESPIISPRKTGSNAQLTKKKTIQGEEVLAPDHTRHLDSVVVQTARSSEFNLMKAEQLQQIDPTTFLGKKELQDSPSESEGKLSRKKSGRRLLSIKKLSRSQRLKIEYATRLRGRHCCLRFMGNVKREISSHNLPINFITTTSAFSPRIMRLCLFTLGILLEVAVCAFFFDLSGEEEEENLTDNFWIGLYSATFVALPMVLSGWLLTYPNKYKKKIEANIHSRNFFQVFQSYSKKFRWIKILGYMIFAILSVFLSLYIIAFCHKASDQISIDWVKSSIIGVSIDQILFEIMPAMVVALFVLLASLGRSLHWIIYMAVCVELYRVYRNLTAG